MTGEKLEQAISRIVDHSHPLRILVFGSRARGDHRPDSDLDLAVILDTSQEEAEKVLLYSVLHGLNMEVTLVVASKQKFDQHEPWVNSIFNYIDREGIVVYERANPESARPDAVYAGASGRVDAPVSAA